jgi:cytochrome c-type biogenesis protein CcmH
MGQFMFFAILLACLAVAFAVSALWQRSRALAIALAIALPLAAGALYWHAGRPAAPARADAKAPETIEQAIAQLQALTAANPKNFADQATLARAYMAAARFDEARAAYAKAMALDPAQTDIGVEYAEAMLRSSADHRFPPESVVLLERALENNPRNQRALFFLGLHQRQAGDPAAAVATWERLLAMLDPAASNELRKQIAAARNEAGLPATPEIAVEVRLDPTLAREVKPGAVLFVFARSTEGQGPPVAAKRIEGASFPVEIGLGDADSPMATSKLFSQRKVVLMARLSRLGDAAAASGDLESDPLVLDVAPGARAELTLNRSLP